MSHDAQHPTDGNPMQPSGDPWEMLDAYLDGVLEGHALASFEQALARDASLRAEVESQHSIDDSLSRLFHREAAVALPSGAMAPATPAAAPSLKYVEAPTGPRVSAGRRMPAKPLSRWTAAAALLVIGGLAGLYVTGVMDPAKLWAPSDVISPEIVYERKVKSGYSPDWVCETDEQFITNTTDYLGEPFLIRSTDSVEVVGWSYYEPVFSSNTVILLTKVDGKEVIVAMDRKENARRIPAPRTGGLKAFQKEVGNAVVVEITPFDAPRVLPLIQQQK